MVERPGDSGDGSVPEGTPGPVPPGTSGGAGRNRRGPGRSGVLGLVAIVVVLAAAGAAVIGGPGSGPGTARGPEVPPSSSAAGSAATPSGGSAGPGSSATPTPVGSGPAASQGASAGSPSPVGRGRLAVVDADGVLSTVDPSGGSQVTYPVPGVRFGFPAWSPDGTRIAAVGQSATDLAIDVFEVGTGGKAAPADRSPTVIYRSAEHPPFYLYWTPDRQHITFLSTEGDSIALRVAPADGSAPLDGSAPGSIIRRGAPLYFDWLAPDRLLLHVGLGADAFLGEVGAAGAPIRPALPGTGSFRPASVSRDGRYVAYAESGGAGPDQVVVAARDGSTSHRVPVFGPAAMTFDPTGDRLAIIGAVARSATNAGLPIGPLRLLEPASGSVRTLLDASVVAFFWAPDGRTIAAIEPSRPGDQPSTTGTDALAPIGTGVLAAVTRPEPPPGRMVAIAGSLARLVFVDAASGVVRSEQVVRLANDLVDFLLPYFDQYALSHRLWSPDGRALVLPLVGADGDGRLVVIPADGSASHVAAEGIKGFWSP